MKEYSESMIDDEISKVEMQLGANISPMRRRDLTKYLKRLKTAKWAKLREKSVQ